MRAKILLTISLIFFSVVSFAQTDQEQKEHAEKERAKIEGKVFTTSYDSLIIKQPELTLQEIQLNMFRGGAQLKNVAAKQTFGLVAMLVGSAMIYSGAYNRSPGIAQIGSGVVVVGGIVALTAIINMNKAGRYLTGERKKP